jgi:hypothetical protein
MKILLGALWLASGLAQAAEFECIYQRETPRNKERHSFFLTESKTEEIKNLRNHAVKVKIDHGSFIVEAREGQKTKVSSIPLRDPFGPKRNPKVPGIAMEVEGIKIQVGCK